MATAFKVKATHKAVKSYYAALGAYAEQNVEHEGAMRAAFPNVLSETGRKDGWTLIPALSVDDIGHLRTYGSQSTSAEEQRSEYALR